MKNFNFFKLKKMDRILLRKTKSTGDKITVIITIFGNVDELQLFNNTGRAKNPNFFNNPFLRSLKSLSYTRKSNSEGLNC